MPLDAVCLRAVLTELNRKAAGGRIDKVYQPDRDEIVLSIRGIHGAMRLMVSAEPSAPRMHFIDANRENPAAPNSFKRLQYHALGRFKSYLLNPSHAVP